jgi:ComF family protein
VISGLRSLWRGTLDLIYPPTCLFCDELLSEEQEDFCPPCRVELVADPHETCPRCAESVGGYTADPAGCPRCRDQTLHFDAAFRMGPHAGKLRDAILRVKKAERADLAEGLGRLWASTLAEQLKGERFDVVVPVPLHWLRRLERGYNQAAMLARPLAKQLRVPFSARRLRRIRYTSHQTGQSAASRQENLRGAFASWPAHRIRGLRILLVDDVMTTGSTCSEAARALKKAGAARVVAAVLARAEQH